MWRKKILPEGVPDSYQGFRNALYLQRYRVARVHQQGVLEVAVKTLNGQPVAIVFYDPDVIRDFGINMFRNTRYYDDASTPE